MGLRRLTAVTHVPYAAFLAAAYDHGDFSVAYPIARGSGAALAGLGGVLLLGDHLGVLGGVGLLTVAAGMVVLAAGADRVHVLLALGVGVTIGVYTVNDSHASRTFGVTYAFAAFALAAIAVTSYGIVHRAGTGPGRLDAHRLAPSRGERGDDRRRLRDGAHRGAASAGGDVASLRESSVLAAAFLGDPLPVGRPVAPTHRRRRRDPHRPRPPRRIRMTEAHSLPKRYLDPVCARAAR